MALFTFVTWKLLVWSHEGIQPVKILLLQWHSCHKAHGAVLPLTGADFTVLLQEQSTLQSLHYTISNALINNSCFRAFGQNSDASCEVSNPQFLIVQGYWDV